MIVKPYANENLKDLAELMNQWSETVQYKESEIADSIEEMTRRSDNKIFIAQERTGKVVGYIATGICCYPGTKPFVEVIQLLVDHNSRSQGVGTLLVQHVSECYKKEGIHEMKLHSRIDRERAHHFYRKLGFKEFKQSLFFEKPL